MFITNTTENIFELKSYLYFLNSVSVKICRDNYLAKKKSPVFFNIFQNQLNIRFY